MRRRLRMLVILLLSGVGALGILAWRASEEIIHPQRRTLQDYHLEILANPSKHGLSIHPFTVPASADSGYPTPAIMCEPSGTPGTRGQKLRDQLSARLPHLAPHGKILGTIVLLHGRKGRKEDGLPVAERFCAAGFRCILIDLPGHGENTDPVASYGLKEWPLPDRVEKYAQAYFNTSPVPRFLWGISQGGSVAVHAASHTPDWKALIVVSSFSNFEAICLSQSQRYFGFCSSPVFTALQRTVKWRAGYSLSDISPIKLVGNLTLPTFMAHGDADKLIDISDGKKLFDAFTVSDKKWNLVQGGTHDHVLTTPMPLYADMAQFFIEHLSTK